MIALLTRRSVRRFRRSVSAQVGLVIILAGAAVALLAPLIAPHDPTIPNLVESRLPPSSRYLLGTDEMGQDILSRIIYGFRISLSVGVISTGIGLGAGVLIGAPSGFQGGTVDLWLMRLVDVMLAFPTILLAIIVVVVLGPGLRNAMIAVGLAQVPIYARLARALVLKVREEEFVAAATALGCSRLRILRRHLLPNCMAPLIVQGTLTMGAAILEAAGLGFLGLGAQPPTPEWGVMLSKGRMYMMVAPHIALFPGLAIMAAVLAFNLLGDGLRDVLDPRMA